MGNSSMCQRYTLLGHPFLSMLVSALHSPLLELFRHCAQFGARQSSSLPLTSQAGLCGTVRHPQRFPRQSLWLCILCSHVVPLLPQKQVCRISAVEVGSLSSYRKVVGKVSGATKPDRQKTVSLGSRGSLTRSELAVGLSPGTDL